MSTPTLKEEVKLLRSALIGLLGKDQEGEYRPDFVREMFADLKRRPIKTFTDKKSFLDEVAKVK